MEQEVQSFEYAEFYFTPVRINIFMNIWTAAK
jgi:hypothetical protein